MSSLGDFQANVGIFSADMNYIISIGVCIILIIIGITLAVLAFIPMKPGDCNKTDTCNTFGDTSKQCKDETNRCNKKTKNYGLLLFLLLIPLGLGIFYFARWWKKYVHKNKTAAQIGGTLFEINTAKNIFK